MSDTRKTMQSVHWAAAALLALSSTAACARFAAPPDSPTRDKLWMPQAARIVSQRGKVLPASPFVPATAGHTYGRAHVAPSATAAFLLEPGAVVRVTHLQPGSTASLRFARVVGHSAATRAVVSERGTRGPGNSWYLVQPPGRASVWMVWASRPTQVAIQNVQARRGRLVWDLVRAQALRWIDGKGAFPPVPRSRSGQRLAQTLRGDETIATLLQRTYPTERVAPSALSAWRKARALAAIELARPSVAPYVSKRDIPLQGGPRTNIVTQATMAGPVPAPARPGPGRIIDRRYSVVTKPLTRKLRLTGPGTLVIEARPVADRARTSQHLTASISSAGLQLALSHERVQQAAIYRADDRRTAAFPVRHAVQTTTGQPLGYRQAMRIALYPGTHEYVVDIRGASAVVRGTIVTRRSRLREHIARTGSQAHWLAAGLAAVRASTSAGAMIARRLLRGLAAPQVDTAPLGPVPAVLGLAALAPVASRLTAPRSSQLQRIRSLIAQLSNKDDSAISWQLRVEFARGFARWGLDHTVLLANSARAPARFVEPIATLLAQTAAARPYQQVFGQTETHWRASAASPARTNAYLRTWRAGAWQPVGAFAGTSTRPLRPASWLHRNDDSAPPGERTRPSGSPLWVLPVGRSVQVAAPRSAYAPTRPALMRLYAVTPATNPGPLTIGVDGKRWTTVAFSHVEPMTFAMPAGTHRVQIAAPPGSTVLSDLPPANEMQRSRLGGAATLRRLWPATTAGAPTRFRIPESTQTPVRIELALLGGAAVGATPRDLSLHSETGVLRTIRWTPGLADSRVLPISASRGLSSPLSVIAWLPPGTTTVWLEGTTDDVMASVAVRTARSTTAPTQRDAGQPKTQGRATQRQSTREDVVIARIRSLSRQLATRPSAASPRLERAELLLYIGAAHRARADITWLENAVLTPALAQRLQAIETRLSAWSEPRHLRIQPPAGALREVQPLAPLLLALTPLGASQTPQDAVANWLDTARVARTTGGGPVAAALTIPAAGNAQRRAAVAARLHMLQQDPGRAAQVLLAAQPVIPIWQISLATVRAYAQSLIKGTLEPKQSAIAFGLASQLRPRLEHRTVRKVLLATARSSRWLSINRLASSAGFERANITPRASDLSPSVQLASALTAPPWPDVQAHLLRPGRGARLQLALRKPAQLQIQVWCRSLGNRTSVRAPCSLELRRGDQPHHVFTVPRARVYTHTTLSLAPGPHDIAVVLVSGSKTDIASVKYVVRRAAAPSRSQGVVRASRLHVAAPERSVQFALRGPTTLRVRARADLAASASKLTIDVRDVGKASTRTVVLDLPRVVDAAAYAPHGRSVKIGKFTERQLLLPSSGVYRISASTSRGRAFMQFAHRRGAPADTPDAAVADTAHATPHVVAHRGLVVNAATRSPPPPRIGTLSLELVAGNESVVEPDFDVGDLVSTQMSLAALWRREVTPRRLWLRTKLIMRSNLGDSTSFGASVGAQARSLPRGLRAALSLSALSQRVEGAMAWSVRTTGRLDRPYARPWGTLTPGVSLRLRSLSLRDRDDLVGSVDSLIVSDYALSHPRAVVARLAARRYFFQDQVGSVSTRVVSNADLASVDQVSVAVAWRGLLELSALRGPVFRLRYRPALRFADDDRSAASLRNDFGAGLGWTTWNGRRGRLLFGIDSNVYVTGISSAEFVLRFSLRYDLTRGRALRDHWPSQREFGHLTGWRLWSNR